MTISPNPTSKIFNTQQNRQIGTAYIKTINKVKKKKKKLLISPTHTKTKYWEKKNNKERLLNLYLNANTNPKKQPN